jgi:uncharacterized protein
MDPPHPARNTRIALLFEGGLGITAVIIGWLVGQWPFIGMEWHGEEARQQLVAAAWGLIATGPLLVALLAVDHLPLGPLRRLKEMASEVILQMFGGASALQLAVVAATAGLGEELLFRGLVQAGLSRLLGPALGPWIALAGASVLFGVCHWLNTTYAILAMLAGVYFGLLLMATGSLWTPIVAHAAYDFLALFYLIRPNRLIRSGV